MVAAEFAFCLELSTAVSLKATATVAAVRALTVEARDEPLAGKSVAPVLITAGVALEVARVVMSVEDSEATSEDPNAGVGTTSVVFTLLIP